MLSLELRQLPERLPRSPEDAVILNPLRLATRTILVADPMVAVRYYVTMLLRNAGYLTIEAADGLEALRLLRDRDIDLALLDVLLPRLSGLEVLCEVATFPRRTPVLLFTGLTCVTSAAEASRAGAIDYLTKPIRNHDLLEAVGRALGDW